MHRCILQESSSSHRLLEQQVWRHHRWRRCNRWWEKSQTRRWEPLCTAASDSHRDPIQGKWTSHSHLSHSIPQPGQRLKKFNWIDIRLKREREKHAYGDRVADVMMPGFGAGNAVEAREGSGGKEEVDGGGDRAVDFVFRRELRGGKMNGMVSECFDVEATFWVRLQIQLLRYLWCRQTHSPFSADPINALHDSFFISNTLSAQSSKSDYNFSNFAIACLVGGEWRRKAPWFFLWLITHSVFQKV